MIIVLYQDYDYSEIIGIWETKKEAFAHFMENGFKPQHYEWYLRITPTKLEPFTPKSWCAWSYCYQTKGLEAVKDGYTGYCDDHIKPAIKQFKKEEAERKKREEEWEAGREERERKERESFAKFMANIPMSGSAVIYDDKFINPYVDEHGENT